MGLPKIKHPLFDLTIPSTGKKVKFRPFTVKEEKILLIAQESKDIKDAIQAIKQIINNCVMNVDVDQLAIFDIEYIFVMLRSKSVNNIVEFQITDPETKEKIPMSVDLSEMKVAKDPNHTNKIYLTNDIILMMDYPVVDHIELIADEDMNSISELLKKCMNCLVDGDTVYKFSEYSEEEIDEFFNDLSAESANKIKEFFETMPKLQHEIKYTNSKGNNKTFVLEGTKNFFL